MRIDEYLSLKFNVLLAAATTGRVWLRLVPFAVHQGFACNSKKKRRRNRTRRRGMGVYACTQVKNVRMCRSASKAI